VGQIRSFVKWVGAGRTLTQTGKIGLADARRLAERLGTGDTIDPKIGDRVFRTTSSAELGYLTRPVEWAKAARLVRVTGSRLVPVKNAALPGRAGRWTWCLRCSRRIRGSASRCSPGDTTVSRWSGTSSAMSAKRL
jgi:hypothetical protein